MDTPSSPAVSVLIPVYDAGRFLAPAIESVLAQTFADFELIAIDDGSRDASGRLLDEFAARDRRLRVVHQDNQGIVASLNRALALARAPLVARMDADDVARPDRFAKQVAFLAAHPEIAVVSGAMDIIDEDGRYLRTDLFPTQPDVIARELLDRNCVCHPVVMARTAVLRSVGGYRKSAQYAEDYDLWLRIVEIGQIANLPDVLLSYRQHLVTISAQRYMAQELAALAVRGAARLRRGGRPDPLASRDADIDLGYRSWQRRLEGATPRAEFAFGFCRAVLSRAAEVGSLATWAKFYLRYGLWDLDGEGAAIMILYLGHVMLRRRRGGAALAALVPYPFWALVTAVAHPIAALRLALDTRHWIDLARAKLSRPVAECSRD
ncbi:MAG TPA: glycosyltransferase [Xanthobacteraceae bacterium]|nr:glycosyltransferase [Xanthobacteraceae bacterium]